MFGLFQKKPEVATFLVIPSPCASPLSKPMGSTALLSSRHLAESVSLPIPMPGTKPIWFGRGVEPQHQWPANRVGTGGCYQVKAGVVHAPTPTVTSAVTPGQLGVESVFKSLKANQKDLNDMGKVVEIVTKEGVNIAG